MPATPLHLGPGLFAAALLLAVADLPSLLIASIILDVEPGSNLVLRLSGLNPPFAYHGFLHSFLGATVAALILAPVLLWLAQKLRNRKFFGHFWAPTAGAVLLACLVGTNLHILVDSFVNTDMQPFWPYLQNPLLGLIPPLELYVACLALFILGAALLAFRLRGSRFLKPAFPK
ncbi:Uncharacterised protein [Candidatus Burarchaeum australiense]|nr:Uncharacterised protein [Candidatus Burarchaeum australiense]